MAVVCFHCKQQHSSTSQAGRPVIDFRETCTACGTDIHICMNCSFYDPGVYRECRESSAEWVKDKERANRCEYFEAKDGPDDGTRDAQTAARSALEDLFKK